MKIVHPLFFTRLVISEWRVEHLVAISVPLLYTATLDMNGCKTNADDQEHTAQRGQLIFQALRSSFLLFLRSWLRLTAAKSTSV